MRQLAVLVITVGLLTGCGAALMQEHAAPALEPAGPTTDQEVPDRTDDGRRIVVSGQVLMRTDDPDSIHVMMMTLATEYDGYVLSSQENKTTIRIPAGVFQAAMSAVEGWGEVIERRVFGQDVTEDYYDLQIRVGNLEATRERYLALLENAGTIDEMLRLERELERLSREIDVLRGKLQRLSHRVAYGTLTVETVGAESRPGPIAAFFGGIYNGMKWLVVRD